MTVAASLSPLVLDERRRVEEALTFIRSKTSQTPSCGLILGSGLGLVADALDDATVIPYGAIPHFPVSTAPGHAGNLLIGQLAGRAVAMLQGRFHLYEGYTAQQVAFPIRVLKRLGVETLIVTCATGGLNARFKAGDLMLIHDHINLTGQNPLVGPNDPSLGERFPVMFNAYRPELNELARRVAVQLGLYLQEGTYAGILGPAYCTKAELRFLTKIGADSVGMSTVHEVIAAAHLGLRVLGIGTISDMAIPDSGHHATEAEILEVAQRVGPTLARLLRGILAEL
ncbi:MAG: purine-nucleoside phosphorylase [Candidatus Sericytochromatia bacterium]|nr:purine-nucleoside phosphorylase [Candidatus Sericytochromatia bacterium]